MAQTDDDRKRRAHRRLDPDDPLNDILDDSREAARRRLERRRASRAAAEGGTTRSESKAQSRSEGARKRGGASRASSADDLPVSIDHADLTGGSSRTRSSRASHSSSLSSALVSLPRPAIIAAGIVVLVILFAIVGAIERSCAAGPETATPVEVQQEGEANQQEQPEEPAPEQADLSKLPAGIDQDLSDSLASLAQSDERVAHIINTIGEAMADDGEAEQIKMLKLVVNDPSSIDFVAGLADNYPAEEGQPYDGSVAQGEIPLLMQWDARWGYTTYCGQSFASAGCCPTSLSMVYMGLTGKTDMTPYDMGQLATKGGYAVDYQGTIGDFLVAEAPDLGLQCEQFYPDADILDTYLESGYTVICNVGPGDFTTTGHFFVITGKNDEGDLTINDPYSAVRSAKAWDEDTVVGQTIAFYAFKAA